MKFDFSPYEDSTENDKKSSDTETAVRVTGVQSTTISLKIPD